MRYILFTVRMPFLPPNQQRQSKIICFYLAVSVFHLLCAHSLLFAMHDNKWKMKTSFQITVTTVWDHCGIFLILIILTSVWFVTVLHIPKGCGTSGGRKL